MFVGFNDYKIPHLRKESTPPTHCEVGPKEVCIHMQNPYNKPLIIATYANT